MVEELCVMVVSGDEQYGLIDEEYDAEGDYDVDCEEYVDEGNHYGIKYSIVRKSYLMEGM